MTNLESLQSLYSDLHKDVYGWRPRGCSDVLWNSEDELQRSIDELTVLLVDRMDQEEAEYTIAEEGLQVYIANLISAGCTDPIAELHKVYDTDGDDQYLDYKLGVRYGTINKLRGS